METTQGHPAFYTQNEPLSLEILTLFWYIFGMPDLQSSFLGALDSGRCLADLFRDAPDLYFYVKDRRFRFMMCNRPLLDRLGVSDESEIIGTDDYAYFDRSVADHYREEDEEVFGNQEAVTNRVWLVPNVKGTVTWYLSSKYPLFDRKGAVTGLAGLMRDCSQAGSLLGPYRNLSTAIEFIGRQFDQPITVGELAAMSHLSISQFERSFRKYFKTTPMKYVNQVRLDAAARLLAEGDQSIASIAQATGFYDHSYFTKQFRSAKGMSPSAYRRHMIG